MQTHSELVVIVILFDKFPNQIFNLWMFQSCLEILLVAREGDGRHRHNQHDDLHERKPTRLRPMGGRWKRGMVLQRLLALLQETGKY